MILYFHNNSSLVKIRSGFPLLHVWEVLPTFWILSSDSKMILLVSDWINNFHIENDIVTDKMQNLDLHPNMLFVWTCEHNSKGGSYTMLLVYYHLIRTLQDFFGQTSVEDLHSCSFRKRVNLKQPSEYYLREWQLQPLILPCSTFLQGSLSPPVRLAFGKVSGNSSFMMRSLILQQVLHWSLTEIGRSFPLKSTHVSSWIQNKQN